MNTEDFKTPMMQQYASIKKDYPDCILFFRMGDFYEMFHKDAEIGSELLGITLTARSKGTDGQIPMCGVPYHAADTYIAKLIKLGKKVAICEQVSKPTPGQDLVERKVIRIVTPGSLIEENLLNGAKSNYLLTFSLSQDLIYLAYCDLSTGEFYSETHNIDKNQNKSLQAISIIKKIDPSEIIIPSEIYENFEFINLLATNLNSNIFPFHYKSTKTLNDLQKYICDIFKIKSLAIFNLDETDQILLTSIEFLITYLEKNLKTELKNFRKISTLNRNDYMHLDADSIINLEIFSSNRLGNTKSQTQTFFETINQTQTPMGERLLHKWIIKPLIKLDEINIRHESTEKIINTKNAYRFLDENLNRIKDIERLASKIALLRANPRDLKATVESLNNALVIINTENIKQILPQEFELTTNDQDQLSEFINFIDTSILENPPITIREGKMINPEFNKDLKSLLDSIKDTKEWISNLESKEKSRTGISTLKVGFNSVFGYYIEITKANSHLAPENYIRKQTLVNAERYITQELKEKESIVLSAEEKIFSLEFEIFNKILVEAQKYIESLQRISQVIAYLDCVFCFAKNAILKNYIKPQMFDSNSYNITIKEGRHPVIETFLPKGDFVPNDLSLTKNTSIHLITGPNMAGKSTFIRQTALIQIMAQIGSYVPAYSAEIAIVDAIYTRIGAGDALIQGLSTFMVEMIETAKILNNATENSLVILDEVGRGTSTLDGLSIAKAVLEYIHEKIKCKTLFATHFHELAQMPNQFHTIENYRIKVSETNESGQIRFLHKVEKGFTDKSYGIEVAKLAGLPTEVIDIAKKHLNLQNKLQLTLGL